MANLKNHKIEVKKEKSPLDLAKDLFKKHCENDGSTEEYKLKIERLENCRSIEELELWVAYWNQSPIYNMSKMKDAEKFVLNVIEHGNSAWTLF